MFLMLSASTDGFWAHQCQPHNTTSEGASVTVYVNVPGCASAASEYLSRALSCSENTPVVFTTPASLIAGSPPGTATKVGVGEGVPLGSGVPVGTAVLVGTGVSVADGETGPPVLTFMYTPATI